jgi:hypothetical protein
VNVLYFQKGGRFNFKHAVTVVVPVHEPPHANNDVFFESVVTLLITEILLNNVGKWLGSDRFELTALDGSYPFLKGINSVFIVDEAA